MDDCRRIAPLEEVPEESTLLFRVRSRAVDAPREKLGGTEDEENLREAIVVRDDGEVRGWLNYCQHLTHIPLDKGTGATMRDGEIVCTNHGAYFEVDTGYCTYGPCGGAYLNGLEVTCVDGAVYLADDGYEFVGRGGIETDDLDRTSRSNLEF